MATVIDTLVTKLEFQTDRRALSRAQGQIKNFGNGIKRMAAGSAAALKPLALGIAAIGSAAFFTGSTAEKEFLKLDTQLGLSRKEIGGVRLDLLELSRRTARPLQELTSAYFNARSGGLGHAKALDAVTASAKAANGQLGATNDITKLATTVQNAYGKAVSNSEDITDKLIATVRVGFLEAPQVIASFGGLLQVAPALGVSYQELLGIIAGGSKVFPEAAQLATQLRQVMFGLLSPTAQAQKEFKNLGISTDEVRAKVGKDGLVDTLVWLWDTIDGNTDALRLFFESTEAQALILDVVSNRTEEYRKTVREVGAAVGETNKAHEAWAKTGFAQAERATNAAKLSLDKLYNTAVVPLLTAFGKMPSTMQLVVVGLAAMSGASLILGGPSALGLVLTVLKGILLPFKLLIVLIALGSAQFWLIVIAIAAMVVGIIWAVKNWDAIVEKLKEVWREHSKLIVIVGNVLAALILFKLGGFGLIAMLIRLSGGLIGLALRLGAIGFAAATTAGAGFVSVLGRMLSKVGLLLPKLGKLAGKIPGMGGSGGSAPGAGGGGAPSASRGGGGVPPGRSRVGNLARGGGRGIGAAAGPALALVGLLAAGNVARAIITGQESDAPYLRRRSLTAGHDALNEYGEGAGAGGGRIQTDNRTFNVNEGAVVVNAAPGQSVVEIGRNAAKALRDEFESLPRAFDSDLQL